jgi:hypothetical protein
MGVAAALAANAKDKTTTAARVFFIFTSFFSSFPVLAARIM